MEQNDWSISVYRNRALFLVTECADITPASFYNHNVLATHAGRRRAYIASGYAVA